MASVSVSVSIVFVGLIVACATHRRVLYLSGQPLVMIELVHLWLCSYHGSGMDLTRRDGWRRVYGRSQVRRIVRLNAVRIS